jgi:hypothetical protein
MNRGSVSLLSATAKWNAREFSGDVCHSAANPFCGPVAALGSPPPASIFRVSGLRFEGFFYARNRENILPTSVSV